MTLHILTDTRSLNRENLIKSPFLTSNCSSSFIWWGLHYTGVSMFYIICMCLTLATRDFIDEFLDRPRQNMMFSSFPVIYLGDFLLIA